MRQPWENVSVGIKGVTRRDNHIERSKVYVQSVIERNKGNSGCGSPSSNGRVGGFSAGLRLVFAPGA
jgi:hypothetical protein